MRRLAFFAVLLLSCHRPREEPPDHLARFREWKSAAPAIWNAEEGGLLPWMSAADADAIVREGSVEGPAYGFGCELTVRGYTEQTFIKGPNSERPDLSIQMWIGTNKGRYFLRVEGPDNQNDIRMAFPFTGLKKGDPVVVNIMDRDAIGATGVDHIEAVLEGPPPFRLVGRNKRAELSCRSLVAAPFERAFAEHEAKVKELVAALEKRRPNPALANLGLPRIHEHEERDAVIAMAPFVGWSDPRMKTAVASLEAAQAASDGAFRKFVLDERARVGSQTTLEDGLVVKARRVKNEPPEIELDVKNPTSTVIVLGAPFHGLESFGVDGTRTELFPDESTYDFRVQPGATATLHYRGTVGAGYESPKAAALIRAHRRAVTLGMDQPFISPVTNVKLTAHLECDAKDARRGCTMRMTAEDLALGDAKQGLRIESIVRGHRASGTEWRAGEWTFRERDLKPEDVTVMFECADPHAEMPWSVATDR